MTMTHPQGQQVEENPAGVPRHRVIEGAALNNIVGSTDCLIRFVETGVRFT